MKKDKVVFRKFPEGDIIAIFPNIKADLKGNVQSYQHIGQHGACDPSHIRELKKATPKEYRDLKQELISIGYKL